MRASWRGLRAGSECDRVTASSSIFVAAVRKVELLRQARTSIAAAGRTRSIALIGSIEPRYWYAERRCLPSIGETSPSDPKAPLSAWQDITVALLRTPRRVDLFSESSTRISPRRPAPVAGFRLNFSSPPQRCLAWRRPVLISWLSRVLEVLPRVPSGIRARPGGPVRPRCA